MRLLPAASLLYVLVVPVTHVSASSLYVHPIAFHATCSSTSSSSGRSGACKAAAAAAAAPAGAAAGQVDVEQVKRLRQLTAAGYGSCVKALQQSGGDLPKAVSWLRQQGAADAAAAAAAATAAAAAAAAAASTGAASEAQQQQQGAVALFRVDSTAAGATAAEAAGAAAASGVAATQVFERVAAVQLACRTDFVSRSDVFTAAARRAAAAACQSESFAAAARAAAAAAAAGKLRDEAAQAQQQQLLLQHLLSLPSGETAAAPAAAAPSVAEDLGFLSRLVGESTTLRRVALREAPKGRGIVSSYSHQPIVPDVAPLLVLLQLSYTRQQQQEQQQHEQQQQEGDELETQERQFAVDSLNRSSSSSKGSSKSSSKSSSSNSSNNKRSSSKVMQEALKQKILEGKLSKWYREVVLLKQPWALDDNGEPTETIIRDTGRRLGLTIPPLAAAGAEAAAAAAHMHPQGTLLQQQQQQLLLLPIEYTRLPMQTAATGPPRAAGAAMTSIGAPVKALRAHGSLKEGSSTWEEADSLSPREELHRLLLEARAADLAAFGVETHARIPHKPYRCGPWPVKTKRTQMLACKPQRREACDPVHADALETPRFSAESIGPTKGTAKAGATAPAAAAWASAASSSRHRRKAERRRPPTKPLPDYSIGGFVFGRHTRCWGLEPFGALSPDEYLRGPGGTPLSSADRSLLKRVGVDFLQTTDADTRKLWMPHERERWRRSKRLRYLMKKGLVVFREDYLRAEFERDFLRFLGRPPKAREIPWGPLEAGDQAVDIRAIDAGSRQRGRDYAASLPWSYFFEVKHEMQHWNCRQQRQVKRNSKSHRN
ncbi:hypothetical protein ACSSS7_003637 [Eimeria intestinalis]